ncbi:MAG: hypothetical protein JW994_02515, partial [Candidatus Omnitrophica bacterium]|nr:hypothetical protein [Candidatus Omnitrophota bacterium]
MKKILSVVTVLCFLVSNIGFASDTYIMRGARGNINLAAPLLLDDMGADSKTQKQRAVAEVGLELELKGMQDAIAGQTDAKAIQRAFDKFRKSYEQGAPANKVVVTYVNQIEQLGENIFSIAARVTQGTSESKGYILLFSTQLNPETGMFPVRACTLDEKNKFQVAIATRQTLPLYSPEDMEAVELFKAHDRYDRFLEEAHSQGLVTEIQIARHIDRVLGIAGVEIEKHPTLKAPQERKHLFIPLEANITIEGKTYTAADYLKECKLPVRYKFKGQPEVAWATAYAHSSNENTHYVMPQATIDALKKQEKRDREYTEKVGSGEKPEVLQLNDGEIILAQELYTYLPHELGIITGQQEVQSWMDGTRPLNKMDSRFSQGLGESSSSKATLVDLDILRKNRLDYAASAAQKAEEEKWAVWSPNAKVKAGFQKLFDLGHAICLDGFLPKHLAKVKAFIREKLVWALTTNNAIVLNILGGMKEQKLTASEFSERFLPEGVTLSDEDVTLGSGQIAELNEIVGELMKLRGENPDLKKPENEADLIRQAYEAISEKLVAKLCVWFQPIWKETNHRHGYVSIELFTKDALPAFEGESMEAQVERIVAAAKGKFKRVQDEIERLSGERTNNIFIKVPSTEAGLRAGEILIATGYNINFTLVCTEEQYRTTTMCWKEGVEIFVERAWDRFVVNPPDKKTNMKRRKEAFIKFVRENLPQSVSSTFVSRDDRNADDIITDFTFTKMLEHLNLRLEKGSLNETEEAEVRILIKQYEAFAYITRGITRSEKEGKEFIKYVKQRIKSVMDSANMPSDKREALLKLLESKRAKPEVSAAAAMLGMSVPEVSLLWATTIMEFDWLKGGNPATTTKVAIAFAKAKMWPIYNEEFNEDTGWQEWLAKLQNTESGYGLPEEIIGMMTQQIYFASTGVKVGADYTTLPTYMAALVAPGTTDTVPYPVIFDMG